MSDVGSFPFIQAAHYHPGRNKQPRLIVIHDMEAPEKATTALSVARYFAQPDSRVASAHFCIDSAETIRCVHDADTAFGAASANADGLHIEHAGYERQSRAEWVDTFGRSMLARSAQVAALWSARYGIPVKHLTVEELKAGKPGFVGHADVSAAWPSTGHSDPGVNFPWAFYFDLVRNYLSPAPPSPVPPQEDDMPKLQFLRAGGVPNVLWLSDLLTRRKVTSDQEVQRLVKLGVEPTIHVVSTQDIAAMKDVTP